VTFSGGEPLIQSENLQELIELIKLKNLSILCYTGHTLQNIIRGKVHYAKSLLPMIDILIDGQYRREEKAFLPWLGSRNQKIHFLTDRYKKWESLVLKEGRREVEIVIGKENLAMTGFFDTEVWERLQRILCSGRSGGIKYD